MSSDLSPNTAMYVALRVFCKTVYCTLYSAHCTLITAHCIVHTAHCTLHTAHCTLLSTLNNEDNTLHCILQVHTSAHQPNSTVRQEEICSAMHFQYLHRCPIFFSCSISLDTIFTQSYSLFEETFNQCPSDDHNFSP